MAGYYWRNANNDRDGTDGSNFDDFFGDPYAEGNPPGPIDIVVYDGGEDFDANDIAGLPNVMVASIYKIEVHATYAVGAGVVDFTTFAVAAVWEFFSISDGITLQMSGTPTILPGGELAGFNTSTLDTANPLTTAGVCLISWNHGNLDIFGGINAAHTITHINGAGSSLDCDITGTLNLGSVTDTGIAVDINTAGTVTLGADVYCGDFTRTAGVHDWADFSVTCSGSYAATGGTLANAGELIMTGTGTLVTGTTNFPNYLTLVSGANVTLGAASRSISGVCVPEGATFNLLGFIMIAMNNSPSGITVTAPHIDTPGTVTTTTGILQISPNRAIDNTGDVLVPGVKVEIRGSADLLVTQSGSMSCGDINIRSDDTGTQAFTCNGTFNAADVTLGVSAGLNRSGVLTINGIASMATLASSNDANLANAITFGDGSHVEFSGLADFDNIAVTASTDMPPEIVCGPGGKVTNCQPDNPIALFGDANVDGGGNNENITNFVNNQDYPGGLMMRGIGGGRLIA